MIKSYTEHVSWLPKINNQWFLKGSAISPSVSSDSVCFNSFLNREIECLLYTNNLLNSYCFIFQPFALFPCVDVVTLNEQFSILYLNAKGLHQLVMLAVKQLTNVKTYYITTLTNCHTKIYYEI